VSHQNGRIKRRTVVAALNEFVRCERRWEKSRAGATDLRRWQTGNPHEARRLRRAAAWLWSILERRVKWPPERGACDGQ